MLPRAQRLVTAADHRSVARRGRRARRGSLLVKCLHDQNVGTPRLAVVVPKALGSAPVRNRLRRRLQNLAAPLMGVLAPGSLVVVRAEPGAADVTYETLGASLDAALTAAGRPSAGGAR